MSSEVEETLKRIQSHRGKHLLRNCSPNPACVKGVLILNKEGLAIRSNLSQEDTDTYASLISQLNFKANGIIRTLDETDSLTFLRLRSNKQEIMVCTPTHSLYPADVTLM
ncbi:unnamed protein product [Chrysoparadoxa australica]